MNNNNINSSLDEIEELLSGSTISDELLGTLKESSADNADIAELLYKYYLNSNDYDNAIYYLELGDKFDDSYAQLYLASLYQQGKYCTKNEERAQVLFERSARNGEPEAQYELGSSLLLAARNQQEIDEACYWLNESFLNGNDDSEQLLAYVGI